VCSQFAAAVKAFRGAGVKVLLYSSLVHKGDDVQWANGERAHMRSLFA
jgi:hypothetical protein